MTEDSPFGRRRRPVAKPWEQWYAAIGVLVVTAAVVLTPVLWPQPDECAAGIARIDGECVGVTDGSFVFDPKLADIEAKILAENRSIADQPKVTVAYLGPITAKAGGTVTVDRIRSQLEGAYLAQHQQNTEGVDPKIRFVLANQGNQELHWSTVVDQLVAMANGDDHLVTVIGLSQSIKPTALSASALARAHIPMVGATAAADGLNSTGLGTGVGPIDGLTRVNVDVKDEFTVLDRYLATRPKLSSALVVGDTNPADYYTASLTYDFETILKRYWDAGHHQFDPYNGAPGTRGVDNQFQTISEGLCGIRQADLVFYAGRSSVLPTFVDRLRKRGCRRDETITVVTGSEATALRTTLAPAQDGDAPVSVLYAALADPDALRNPKLNPRWVQDYLRFEQAFTQQRFPAPDLKDGWAVMTHDSMLAAIHAIRKATGQSTELPDLVGVHDQLYEANTSTTAVSGAGGQFTTSNNGDVNGRLIPVVEIVSDGRSLVRAVYPVR